MTLADVAAAALFGALVALGLRLGSHRIERVAATAAAANAKPMLALVEKLRKVL